MEVYGVVYLIIDGTNDMEYVGQTVHTVEKRFKEHASGKYNTYISNAIQAHGVENFATAVLKVCYSKEELDYWEVHFIKSRNTKAPNGYNLTDGGGSAWRHTPETCAKIAAANRGKKKSPEHCANLSLAQIKRFQNPDERARLSAAKTGANHPFFGKHHTPEHCANISAALTGRVFSPEHCANLSKVRKGKIPKDETRGKMAEVRRGKKLPSRSPEDRANISAKNRAESPYKNLAAELDAHQLTYFKLAELLGLKTISDKMSGRRRFTDEQIAKLVEIFGKTAEYLLARDENFCSERTSHRRPSPYPNLVRELDARQMTYAALARLMGANKNSIARKMRGVRTFMDKEKAQIAELLGLSIEYLFKRDE